MIHVYGAISPTQTPFSPSVWKHLYDYGAYFNVVRMAIVNIFYIPYKAFCFIYTQLNTVFAETGDFM